jgi:hypothetical protein
MFWGGCAYTGEITATFFGGSASVTFSFKEDFGATVTFGCYFGVFGAISVFIDFLGVLLTLVGNFSVLFALVGYLGEVLFLDFDFGLEMLTTSFYSELKLELDCSSISIFRKSFLEGFNCILTFWIGA